MSRIALLLSIALMSAVSATGHAADPTAAPADEPERWLEDVTGDAALAWVRERNAASQAVLEARPEYAPIRAALLQVLDAKDRIPTVVRLGPWLYNLWQDAANPRGLWRRTTLPEFAKPQPAWETVLDLDALGRSEGENWVWAGATCFGPQYTRCLIGLSRGGADAHVVREFDTVAKRFVADGFVLPEAKSQLDWVDADTVYVATDVGPGSLTDSGYPRVIKRWRRGTPLAQAETVFEGERSDVSVSVTVDRAPGEARTLFARALDFYTERQFLWQPPGADGTGAPQRLQELAVPQDGELRFAGPWALLTLRSDLLHAGRRFKQGSLLVTRADALARGTPSYQTLFEPTATRSLKGWTRTRSHLLLSVLDNVNSRIEELRWDGSAWQRRAVAAPAGGTIGVSSLFDPELDLAAPAPAAAAASRPVGPQPPAVAVADPIGEQYLLGYTDFLTPDSLFLATAGSDARQLLKRRPAFFDADGMRSEQRFATSKDGTQVPYFIVWPKGASADGDNPTLLYGYGGFEISLQPGYVAGRGPAWLARGGVYVVANLRGGGEFGPAWHQAAVKADKQHSYDDFIAVAEDLIARKVTSPARLGIMGGSNGGLLVGATFVQRPELFRAVVCQVPLLDMRRYHLLLAGASWMAEYGNPDVPAEWDWIRAYSPFHNVRPDRSYPEVLFTTSTRDDRVHPGHARKMAARMLAQGHPVLYYENTEGGHGGAADNAQRAHLQALEYAYLWRQLGGAAADPAAAGDPASAAGAVPPASPPAEPASH